jgi:hypothetical protein
MQTMDRLNMIDDRIYCPQNEIKVIPGRIHCPPDEIKVILDQIHCPPDEIRFIHGRIHAFADRFHVLVEQVNAVTLLVNVSEDLREWDSPTREASRILTCAARKPSAAKLFV